MKQGWLESPAVPYRLMKNNGPSAPPLKLIYTHLLPPPSIYILYSTYIALWDRFLPYNVRQSKTGCHTMYLRCRTGNTIYARHAIQIFQIDPATKYILGICQGLECSYKTPMQLQFNQWDYFEWEKGESPKKLPIWRKHWITRPFFSHLSKLLTNTEN